MDAEAASRGTTVYLVDNRIDMLPSLLGTNLCSLRPFVERLAFSAIWVSPGHVCAYLIDLNDRCKELTPEAEIVSVRFMKSVIASKGAFTYEEAQLRKDDPYVNFILFLAILTILTFDQVTFPTTLRSPSASSMG